MSTASFPDYILRSVVLDADMPWWVDESRFQGITLNNVIHLREGVGSLLYSADRAELGGHEIAHVWQYRQGMTISAYVVAHMIMGYDRNPAETAADLMGLQSRRNYCSIFNGTGC